MMARIPESHADLIDEAYCVALTTLMPDGPRTVDDGRGTHNWKYGRVEDWKVEALERWDRLKVRTSTSAS
jgi:hypothetical protein